MPATTFNIVQQTDPSASHIAMRSRSGQGNMSNTPIGEPGWLGNPYKWSGNGGTGTVTEAVKKFKAYFLKRLDLDPKFKEAILNLTGKNLGYMNPNASHETHVKVMQDWLHNHNDPKNKRETQVFTQSDYRRAFELVKSEARRLGYKINPKGMFTFENRDKNIETLKVGNRFTVGHNEFVEAAKAILESPGVNASDHAAISNLIKAIETSSMASDLNRQVGKKTEVQDWQKELPTIGATATTTQTTKVVPGLPTGGTPSSVGKLKGGTRALVEDTTGVGQIVETPVEVTAQGRPNTELEPNRTVTENKTTYTPTKPVGPNAARVGVVTHLKDAQGNYLFWETTEVHEFKDRQNPGNEGYGEFYRRIPVTISAQDWERIKGKSGKDIESGRNPRKKANGEMYDPVTNFDQYGNEIQKQVWEAAKKQALRKLNLTPDQLKADLRIVKSDTPTLPSDQNGPDIIDGIAQSAPTVGNPNKELPAHTITTSEGKTELPASDKFKEITDPNIDRKIQSKLKSLETLAPRGKDGRPLGRTPVVSRALPASTEGPAEPDLPQEFEPKTVNGRLVFNFISRDSKINIKEKPLEAIIETLKAYRFNPQIVAKAEAVLTNLNKAKQENSGFLDVALDRMGSESPTEPGYDSNDPAQVSAQRDYTNTRKDEMTGPDRAAARISEARSREIKEPYYAGRVAESKQLWKLKQTRAAVIESLIEAGMPRADALARIQEIADKHDPTSGETVLPERTPGEGGKRIATHGNMSTYRVVDGGKRGTPEGEVIEIPPTSLRLAPKKAGKPRPLSDVLPAKAIKAQTDELNQLMNQLIVAQLKKKGAYTDEIQEALVDRTQEIGRPPDNRYDNKRNYGHLSENDLVGGLYGKTLDKQGLFTQQEASEAAAFRDSLDVQLQKIAARLEQPGASIKDVYRFVRSQPNANPLQVLSALMQASPAAVHIITADRDAKIGGHRTIGSESSNDLADRSSERFWDRQAAAERIKVNIADDAAQGIEGSTGRGYDKRGGKPKLKPGFKKKLLEHK